MTELGQAKRKGGRHAVRTLGGTGIGNAAKLAAVEELLLAGTDVVLDDDILDRIDQLVPPGVTLNAADAGWQSPSLADPAARRRPLASRAAG
jgi:hypothetical protein